MRLSWKMLLCVLPLFRASTLLAQTTTDPFLTDWAPRIASTPLSVDSTKTSVSPSITVTMNPADTIGKVSRFLYGNNANLWMGQIVTEPNLINHITTLSPNIIRFPGGNISSVFFWNAPPDQPPSDAPDTLFDSNGGKVGAGYWYGKDSANWTLSVDNYYAMLSATGSTGIITVNYSYARYGTGPDPASTAAHLAAEWVRYDKGRTRFWEIGNESAGSWQAGYEIDTTLNKDGQPRIITGDMYGKHFLVFADSMRKAAAEVGASISIGAQLIEFDASSSSEPNRSWNSGLFKLIGNTADFFIVHSYFTAYNENSIASVVLASGTATTDQIMNYMKQTSAKNQVALKPIALTEWNIFAVGSKQMVSFVNGMHAAIVLGELAKTGFSMASRWDLANAYEGGNDHGMFNNRDEPGVPAWNPRPPFFTMYYFQKFFGDHIVGSTVVGGRNTVLAYASTFQSGHKGIVVVNKATAPIVVQVDPGASPVGTKYYVYSLMGGTDNGEFSQVVNVNGYGPTNATGGPIDMLTSIPAWSYHTDGGIIVSAPARSVQFVLVEPGLQTSVASERSAIQPDHFVLAQNYPNPFNPTTIVRYQLPVVSRVKLVVYDVLGREVAVLVNDVKNPGSYTVTWDASRSASGMYYYRMTAGSYGETKRMVLMK